MSEAPERIWIEDEFGEGDNDQWTYGMWDVRNYMGYDVEYVRADIVQALTAERDRLRAALANVMGYVDTPISRRRLGIDPNACEWLLPARAALKGEP